MTAPTICLNMIVKNEEDRILRCLTSLRPYIENYVIGDTGSIDRTKDLIYSTLALPHIIYGTITDILFDDFSSARNQALTLARQWSDCDYILLVDADMELMVEGDHNPFEGLTADAYEIEQRYAGISYQNVRLIRRDLLVPPMYHGVTHEYLDTSQCRLERLFRVWFNDHADGSNRPGKFQRDIELLTGDLEKNPGNPRSVFYLAQSYRDNGQYDIAAAAYARRALMGGWDEEAWYARLQAARCLRAAGKPMNFVGAALSAYEHRVWRAEPLYDLAQHYRSLGQNETALLFAERGANLPYPSKDRLFVEPPVYQYGLRREISICGFYSQMPGRKKWGAEINDELTLDPTLPAEVRREAHDNGFFYTELLKTACPSFMVQDIGFDPPEGFHNSTPSIIHHEGNLVALVRCVNYTMDAEGRYMIGDRPFGDTPINTRNFVMKIAPDLTMLSSPSEIRMPQDWPTPKFPAVLGWEDMRLFVYLGRLYIIANLREQNEEGNCEQFVGRLLHQDDHFTLFWWDHIIGPNPGRPEKNWMPIVERNPREPRFLYACDPTTVVDMKGEVRSQCQSLFSARDFRGGSQVIPFRDGHLALVHDVHWRDLRRYYFHRFVFFENDCTQISQVSLPFFFEHRGIEFAAGMTACDDELLITYSVEDNSSRIATVKADEVMSLLRVPTAYGDLDGSR